jgi:hypothetical protein
MDSGSAPNILAALLPAIFGGVLVALVNYIFTRGKTKAEIRNLEAQTEEIRIRMNNVANISATLGYKSAETAERIIYSSENRDIGFDFSPGRGEHIWKNVGGKDTPIGDKGRGSLSFEAGGILHFQKENTEGRIESWLQRYSYNDVYSKSIPKDPTVTQRIIHLSCEAKVIGGEHTLKFLFKNEKTNKGIASADKRVTEESWTKLDMYLSVSPIEECRLRIDDLEVFKVPSSVQLRNLVLVEKRD